MEKDKKSKILNLETLASTISSLKNRGRKIVHCHGVFDLLHVGHIQHLKEAKTYGDVLIVTLTPDQYVNKGPHRPVFPENLRAEAIAAMEAVDYVAINQWHSAVEAIQLLKPDIYVKGLEYKHSENDVTGGIQLEEDAVRSVGGKIKFTNGIVFSSSNLLNKHMSTFSPEVTNYLQDFRKQHTSVEILKDLNKLRSLKVLLVGEAILDEYVYCDALGKSSKEPILALRHLDKELFAGGSLAIANHLADFCKSVDLVTYLGSKNSHEEFVRGHLKPNIHPTFVYKSDSPTIVKRRYVEKYSLSKLMEIYEINDEYLNEQEEGQLCSSLEKQIKEADLVIVADFGHGLITPQAVELLCNKARFLAVSTQMNAANIGFHTISQYARADYVCIHEGEVRLDHRSRKGDLTKLVKDLANRLDCKTIMVTRGKNGTLFYQHPKGFFECPALAVKVVDRIGAGDAVLALTSLCVAKEIPPDIVSFIGNLVGAQAVNTVGNRASISAVQLIKSIESILK